MVATLQLKQYFSLLILGANRSASRYAIRQCGCPPTVPARPHYAARQTPPGLPEHALTVKVNGVYRLIRNLSIDRGLTKNTRVLVKALGRRLITVRVLRGLSDSDAHSEDILLPRITFSTTLPSGHTLLRQQFPLAAAYATTFNSCQGLTLDRIGLDLIRPPFSYGQLYTALSRIRHCTTAARSQQYCQNTTTNVVYPEILI